MTLSTILVIWMDGREETYANVSVSVLNGVLHIHKYTGITNTLEDEWHIPIGNIRTWKPLRPQ